MLSIRSRKVRRILGLEARARRSLGRYNRALEKAVNAKGQAHRFLDQAHGMEATLTGNQIDELCRARAGAAGQTVDDPGAQVRG
ncbi:MAG TPA: hypothetical protein VMN39_01165 [Longimicrobiaceae bacterium]|nr:hypothetical protein [Longimicrobiaceae bacterium]